MFRDLSTCLVSQGGTCIRLSSLQAMLSYVSTYRTAEQWAVEKLVKCIAAAYFYTLKSQRPLLHFTAWSNLTVVSLCHLTFDIILKSAVLWKSWKSITTLKTLSLTTNLPHWCHFLPIMVLKMAEVYQKCKFENSFPFENA